MKEPPGESLPGGMVRSITLGASLPLILNIGSTLLGGSGATVPLAQVIRASGYVVSSSLLICGGIVTYIGSCLLVKACGRTGEASYEGIARHTLGKNGCRLVQLVIVCNSFGECLSILLLFGETLFIGQESETARKRKVAFAALASLPVVCLVRQFHLLAPFSFITALGSLTLLAFIVDRTLWTGNHTGPLAIPMEGVVAGDPDNVTTMIEAIASTAIAMVVQFNVLPAYINLKKRNPAEGEMATYRVLRWGIGAAVSIYVVTDVLSYITFGAVDYDTIIEEYLSMWGGPFGVNALALGQLVSYPLIAHAGVAEVGKLLQNVAIPSTLRPASWGGASTTERMSENSSLLAASSLATPERHAYLCEVVAGVLWVAATCSLGLAISEAGPMLTLTGACCGLPLMAVFPPLMMLYTKPEDGATTDPYGPIYKLALALGTATTAMCAVVSIATYEPGKTG